MRGIVRGSALAAATVLVAMSVAATPGPPTGREVIAEAQAPERRPVFFSEIARVLALAADTVQPQFADARVER
jgi:hypothetical protein